MECLGINNKGVSALQKHKWISIALIIFILLSPFSSYARHHSDDDEDYEFDTNTKVTGTSGMPAHIPPPGEKVVIVDPHVHKFGAYDADGTLLKTGTVTAGRDFCHDTGKPCRTTVGTFRVFSLGSYNCISHSFPIPRGGAPMPYCMYFNGGQALHGHHGGVVPANLSHGCVRLNNSDAKWLRFNFVEGPEYSNDYRGTKVTVRKY